MSEDRMIIKECIRNNRLAQKALFDEYSKHMFTLAYRILNDFDLAHDVIQDAFIEVFRDLKNFRNESPLFTWIKTIVVRKSIRILKTKKEFELIENYHHLRDTAFNDDFTAEDLDKAIRNLPYGSRTIFLLVEVEGYMHQEVAQMLNISEGTSKSQLNYAKKLLRKYLKQTYGYER
jgi:RNA polymerase sigma factor (sigma-70 family)